MHGGAPGSGAPKGNKNALKHGLYTKEAIAERRALREFMREARQKLDEIGKREAGYFPDTSSGLQHQAPPIAGTLKTMSRNKPVAVSRNYFTSQCLRS